jgi:large subunit ribosomal protein L6
MSRIGQKIIEIPDNVEAILDQDEIKLTGPKGELSAPIFEGANIEIADKTITVNKNENNPDFSKNWGLQRTLISNSIIGVSEGYSKKLEINGVGYRAQMKGSNIQLSLGFSHDVNYETPDGIKIETPSQTEIIISGIDKQKVGQVAAEIRAFRPPEPYKGKGIREQGQYILRKEGKKK